MLFAILLRTRACPSKTVPVMSFKDIIDVRLSDLQLMRVVIAIGAAGH